MVEDTRCSEQGRCQVGGEAARKIKRGQKIEKQGQKLGNWRKSHKGMAGWLAYCDNNPDFMSTYHGVNVI